MKSYAKAYDLKSYDSVDNYYSAACALLTAVAEKEYISIPNTPAAEGTANNEVVFLAALAENGVSIVSYAGDDSTSTAFETNALALEALVAYLTNN